MTKKQYQRYSPEFKIQALKRASEDGVTDKDIAEIWVTAASDFDSLDNVDKERMLDKHHP